jgi:hypothetical protein
MTGQVAPHISPQWTLELAGSEPSVGVVSPGSQILIYPVLWILMPAEQMEPAVNKP